MSEKYILIIWRKNKLISNLQFTFVKSITQVGIFHPENTEYFKIENSSEENVNGKKTQLKALYI